MSSGNRRDPSFHPDYPEDFEAAFARNLANFERLHAGVESPPADPSASPSPYVPNRPWAAQWHGGPQTPAPYPPIPANIPRLNNPIQYHPPSAALQPLPVAPQAPVHNVIPPPPPFATGAAGAQAPPAFSAGPSPFSSPAQASAFNTARHNALNAFSAQMANDTPTAYQHGYHNNSAPLVVPGPNAATANSQRPAPAADSNSRRPGPPPARTNSRRPGPGPASAAPAGTATPSMSNNGLAKVFKWNKQSLALLAMWKLKRKKGMDFIVALDIFPGKDADELALVWEHRKGEAKAAYRELYG